MEGSALKLLVLVGTAGFGAAAAVLAFSRFAPRLGLLDHPGGRKSHHKPIPLVGGLAIFTTLLLLAYASGISDSIPFFLVSLSIVIAVGLWDDVTEISPRLKFVIQIVASSIMIWGAGVELRSVGDLLGWRPIGLSVVAIPMTIFAIIGVVNAVNMMDGVDGLAGSLALIAFAWFAAMAHGSGMHAHFITALLFCGAIAGFLLFNLRFPWQPQARVFLGDAGSLMIGFALGWFAIDLSQGPGRTVPPIAALWVLMLPLIDCVSLISRRLANRRSPFVADRQHIHHYLQERGFSHGQSMAILLAVSALFGGAGFVAWKLRLPEAVLFWPFFFGFFTYHFWIRREWQRIERRRIGRASETRGGQAERKIAPAA